MIKVISVFKLVLEDEYKFKVSLDEVIVIMYVIGKDMNEKYKEILLGGLVKILKC